MELSKILDLDGILNELENDNFSTSEKVDIRNKCMQIISKIDQKKDGPLMSKSLTMSSGKCPTCGK